MDLEEVITLVRQEARRIAHGDPMVEADDVEQETLTDYVSYKSRFDEADSTEAMLRAAAVNAAARLRAKAMEQSCQYGYRGTDVAMLLENLFEGRRAELDGDRLRWDDLVASRADLCEAWVGTSDDDKEAIITRYANGDTMSSIDRMRLTRALRRLAYRMNMYYAMRPKVGREAESNAKANSKIRQGCDML